MSPTYASEFTQALSGSRAGRIEIVESLRWFEYQVSKSDVATYPVKIVNKPNQVIPLEVLHALFILLAVKRLVEPIAEVG